VLSRFDDYPIHQVAVPIAQAGGGHPDFYDRFWFNGYTEDTFFAVAMGSYPNRGVIDAAFSVVHDGVQRSVFASGRAPHDRSVTRVGPIAVEIVEPMRTTRVTVDAPEHGLQADIVFEARTAAYEEPRQTRYQDVRLQFDVTRATQFGDWSGAVDTGGARLSLDDTTVWGTKDRSWGIRPVGAPAPMAPLTQVPQLCFLWAPINFPDAVFHYIVFEDADGVPWSEGGAVLPIIGREDDTVGPRCTFADIDDVTLGIDWAPGLRRSQRAELSFRRTAGGGPERITLTPQLTFRMSGVGYTHPTWGHGRWHDELVVGAEAFPVDELDDTQVRNLHVQQVMRAEWGDQVGLGVLEQIVIGPHRARGLTGFSDGAATPA
jgi:hypothetical protein